MTLTSNTNGADGPARADGWRLVAASVATRRTFALLTAFVAALGLLPLYESVWWWDLLTHTLAGAVIAGWVALAGRGVSGVVAVVAFLTGAWELAEYATPNYVFLAGGPVDTAVDAACNYLGAAVAVCWFRAVETPDRDSAEGSERRAPRPDARTGPADD